MRSGYRYDPHDYLWSYVREGNKYHYYYDGRYTHTIGGRMGFTLVGFMLTIILLIFVAIVVFAVLFFSTFFSMFQDMAGTALGAGVSR